MRLVLLADTHVPRRARALPGAVLEALAAADLVVHAGDWVEERALDDLLGATGDDVPLLACWGNNDGDALRARLPEVGRARLAGLRVEVVHETGGRSGRERRCEAAHPAADVLVFGHSHIPWDTTTPRGLRLLNPGSPTDRRRQPRCTYLTVTAADGRLDDVELHALPLRRP
ncbi:metallophosphoesterase family protein [Pseudokineococcus basanitobsidens]|uniref:metallophosphoesterase family protein n=1 Tax=Pseudokineococcus basanitobsidens TaxID=1926649 RepID=UPI003BB7BF6F